MICIQIPNHLIFWCLCASETIYAPPSEQPLANFLFNIPWQFLLCLLMPLFAVGFQNASGTSWKMLFVSTHVLLLIVNSLCIPEEIRDPNPMMLILLKIMEPVPDILCILWCSVPTLFDVFMRIINSQPEDAHFWEFPVVSSECFAASQDFTLYYYSGSPSWIIGLWSELQLLWWVNVLFHALSTLHSIRVLCLIYLISRNLTL